MLSLARSIRFVHGGNIINVAKLTLTSRKMSSGGLEAAGYSFETLKVTKPREYVLQVELNRPEKRNAMNAAFWREMVECFNKVSTDPDCRSVVVSGAGKLFTAGIDLQEIASLMPMESDVGRKSMKLKGAIARYQDTFTCMEKCPKPVIVAVHNACVGGGIDLITACDIRYCSQDAWFQVKEVDVGLAADVGTLQRLPKVVGNDSLARELAYTARKMMADEAMRCGLVSRILPDRESTIEAAIETAALIASKSPIAVQGSKVSIVYSRDHSVQEGLEHIACWNSAMLQSEDVMTAAMAAVEKKPAEFSKL
ncbi:delta(3,5)-Delta(2,4)-dienoyl-CoA isomerase, mitochondrial [Lingula anatina]|uniref:Delta(3,5)-Delta(2,4)-dienoyl-CoA isomerase, mitochondrial n=1 Tax=Lingula anatina TaxID=7574 RepID=A0A1S3K0E9_LINAN|nr:delta(3,5)-Delta(2,4)-dienoyl-CoA isomerase, mitochondrial [Lingula anatina]|eukprot:XP_013416113.1 delta(3,5)-Delta(2,4)-dienoyl-CoA isomerase, mitochondrial [Lingula anatina]